jgi:hypothetical protein
MGVRIDEATGFEPASLQAVLIDRRKIKSKGLPPILILMTLTKVYSLGLTLNNFSGETRRADKSTWNIF